MRMIIHKALIIALISMSLLELGGCASGIVDPVPGSPTVADSYNAAMHGQTTFYRGQRTEYSSNAPLSNGSRPRLELPRLSHASQEHPNNKNETESTLSAQFPKLPNPKSVMYVFGHYAGREQLPVAGHFVPFSLYRRNYYAMPNEVLRPYNDGQFNSSKGNA